MEILSPDDFFARFGTPDEWMPVTKCGGVVTNETTIEEMRARGFSDRAIQEVMAFREWLALPKPRPLTFDAYKAARSPTPTKEPTDAL